MTNTSNFPDAIAFWPCTEEVTEKGWLDHMGHVNIQHYFGMSARAVYELMDNILRPADTPGPLPIFFTLEARIRYLSEIMAGIPVRISMRPISRTEKVLRALIRIEQIGPGAKVSAECEWTGAYADPETRRIAPFSDYAKDRIDRKIEEAAAVPAYETREFTPGRQIGMAPGREPVVSHRGTISPDWMDRMGHMGIENYMKIVFFGNMGYTHATGFDTSAMVKNQWGVFALETHLKFLAEMNQGEPFEVRSRTLEMARTAITIQHEIIRTEPERVTCATARHVMAFADMTKRRTMPVPDVYIQKVSESQGVTIERP